MEEAFLEEAVSEYELPRVGKACLEGAVSEYELPCVGKKGLDFGV